MNKFWMVWVEGNGSPTKKHENRELADSEAVRLAKLTKKKAFILEAIDGYKIVSDSEQVVTPDVLDENKRLRIEIATLRGTISQMEEANREAKSKRFLDTLKEHNNNKWSPYEVTCAQPNISVMFGIDG